MAYTEVDKGPVFAAGSGMSSSIWRNWSFIMFETTLSFDQLQPKHLEDISAENVDSSYLLEKLHSGDFITRSAVRGQSYHHVVDMMDPLPFASKEENEIFDGIDSDRFPPLPLCFKEWFKKHTLQRCQGKDAPAADKPHFMGHVR